MPKYYFDVHDRHGLHRDDFGDECDDIEDAQRQCRILLPDIARHELPDRDLHTIVCDVRDESGRIVYQGRLTFDGTRDPA